MEEQVAMLVSMGFDATQAAGALQLTEGMAQDQRVEAAMNLLLSGDLSGMDAGAAPPPPPPPTTGHSAGADGGFPADCQLRVANGVTQYTYGDQGRSACTSIVVQAALTLLQQLEPLSGAKQM